MDTAKEAPKKDEAPAEEAPPPRKSKKLLIIIVIAVVLLSVLAGGAFLLLGNKKTNAGEEDEFVEEVEPSAQSARKWPKFDPGKPPVFMPLEPFTVNLMPENGEQFLQVVATLRVIDTATGDQIKAFMPQIRHEILSLLAGKKPSEIISPEGRELLATDMKDIINEIMGWMPAPQSKRTSQRSKVAEEVGPVVSVFFTQFIVQ